MSPLPDVDSFASVGGALFNYGIGPIDTSTDRDAAGANVAYWDATAMTATCVRAWARFTLNGTATPALVAHNSVWGNAVGVQPVGAYSGSTGVFTITWPVNVSDGIPNGLPGYIGPHTLNFRDGWANVIGATYFGRQVSITSANVATLYVFNSGGAAANPGSATDFTVYVI